MKIFKKKGGLISWALQRITALTFLSYITYILSCLYNNIGAMDSVKWQNIFKNDTVKISTVLSFVFILIHALIGIRTILQDYVHDRKLQRNTLILSYSLSGLYVMYISYIMFGKNI